MTTDEIFDYDGFKEIVRTTKCVNEIRFFAESYGERVVFSLPFNDARRLADALMAATDTPSKDGTDKPVAGTVQTASDSPAPAVPRASVRFKVYNIIANAVESGLHLGWSRAHKHEDRPRPDIAVSQIFGAVMGELEEVIEMNDEIGGKR